MEYVLFNTVSLPYKRRFRGIRTATGKGLETTGIVEMWFQANHT